jgi:hypothetical protein
MSELRVKDLTGNLSGTVVSIFGEERVIVSGTSSMLWTCSPSEYSTGSVRVVPHALTTDEILNLRFVGRL